MKTDEAFRRVSTEGEDLKGSEATVVLLSDPDETPRIWVGFDSEGQSVAYFDLVNSSTTHFAISQALSVECVEVEEARLSERLSVAKITCHDSRLTGVFRVFIDELHRRITSPSEVLESIRLSANDWRSLLQLAAKGLTENQAMGLYGELLFLETAIERLGPLALELWQRSSFNVHDFIGKSSRVEVKTSNFQDRSAVTIHGLKQLEPPECATLTLAVAEVQQNGGDTIDDVIGRILDKGADPRKLNEKLSDAEYVRGMSENDGFSFAVLGWRFWEINGESPVVNRSVLGEKTSDAVSAVQYKLSLSALGDGEVSFDFQRLADL